MKETHQPLYVKGKKTVKHKENPKQWTHDQTKPENVWLRVWDVLIGFL